MLTVLGIATCLIYLRMAAFDAVNGLAPVLEFLAMMAALFALYALASRRDYSWKALAGWGIAFRLILLTAGLPAGTSWREKATLLRADLTGQAVVYERFLLYDNDIWRYLWDGHVSAAGRNPYLETPSAMPEEGLWEDLRENVSYPGVPTLYPPLAEFVFRLSHWVAPGSVLALKAIVTLFDWTAGILLAFTLRESGMNSGRSVLYLWNPLVIKVFAGSGHIDALVVCALAGLGYLLVRGRNTAAGLVFGLAVLAKFSPLVLTGLLARRLKVWQLALGVAVIALGYAPYLSGGAAIFDGPRQFASFWEFNSGALLLLRWAMPFVDARAACTVLFLAALLWTWRRDREFFGAAADALGFAAVLSPAVMPWYAAWSLPYAIVARRWQWLIFPALVCAAFAVMVDGRERPWILACEYGSFAVAWSCREWFEKSRNKGLQL